MGQSPESIGEANCYHSLDSYLFFNTQVSPKLISKIGGINPVLKDYEVINSAGQDEARNDRLACLVRLQIQDTG